MRKIRFQLGNNNFDIKAKTLPIQIHTKHQLTIHSQNQKFGTSRNLKLLMKFFDKLKHFLKQRLYFITGFIAHELPDLLENKHTFGRNILRM